MPCHKPDCEVCKSPQEISNAEVLAKLEVIQATCVKSLADTVLALTLCSRRRIALEEALTAAIVVLRKADLTLSAEALERVLRGSN